MFTISRGRINLGLSSLAFTISSAGSVLLHIVFSLAIFKQTNSGLITSVFISLQWLPTLLVILYRSDWDYGMDPIKRWYLLDLLSAILTLPILLFIDDSNYTAIVLLLLLRGVVDQINRINKTVCTRIIFPEDKTAQYASFMQTGYHVGIGMAAVAGVFMLSKIELKFVIWFDIFTFIISALLMMFAKKASNVTLPPSKKRLVFKQRITEYVGALKQDGRLLFCAMLPPMTATFFQGTYSVLQPIFPIQHLGLDESAVSLSYILASVAIVVGSFGFSFFNKKSKIFEKNFKNVYTIVISASIFAVITYILCVWTLNPLVSAISFTLMILLFEFLWMAGYVGIVAFSPSGQLGSVFGISFAIGCLLASVIVTASGALLDITDHN
ncbi:MFS transporter, partial [Vibrio agarivorans]